MKLTYKRPDGPDFILESTRYPLVGDWITFSASKKKYVVDIVAIDDITGDAVVYLSVLG